jgi:hypothetical protein
VGSGNPAIAVFRGKPPLCIGQVRVADGRHQGHVVANWTALQPPPSQPDGFEGGSGDPDRGEEVTIEASHDNRAADLLAATSSNDSPPDKNGKDSDDRDDRDERWR